MIKACEYGGGVEGGLIGGVRDREGVRSHGHNDLSTWPIMPYCIYNQIVDKALKQRFVGF